MGDSGQTTAAAQVSPNYGGYAATAASGVASAYAQYQAGRANRRLARINARLANEQADQTFEAAHLAEGRMEAQGRRIRGAQRATAAGTGTVAGAGTQARLAAADSAALSMDRFLLQLNARRQAYGFRSRAAIDSFQGRLADIEGRQGAAAALTGTVGALARQRHEERLLSQGSEHWQQASYQPIRWAGEYDNQPGGTIY